MTTIKKNNGFKLISALMVFISTVIFVSFVPVQDNPWKVPDSAKNMENESEADEEGLAIAKELYSKHCKSCHGKEGLGDGTKAEELDTPAGDFSAEEFQAQTDGELFYKTTEGRDDMPTFKKKIPDDEDRWLIVHYLRTFAE